MPPILIHNAPALFITTKFLRLYLIEQECYIAPLVFFEEARSIAGVKEGSS